MESVDVVIPTRGETFLKDCLYHIRKNMLVNKIILVVSEGSDNSFQFSDVKLVVSSEENVGSKRALGLKYVTTPYYASLESDVLVSKEWFEWCMATIKERDVGACQGFAKDLGKHNPRVQMDSVRRGEFYCTGLGNVMLKTDVVRRVGMPKINCFDDWYLRFRIEKASYKWIINPDIECQHLRTDVDVWKHSAFWAEVGGGNLLSIYDCICGIGWALTIGLLKYSIGDWLFVVCDKIFVLSGYLKGIMKRKFRVRFLPTYSRDKILRKRTLSYWIRVVKNEKWSK